nr:MAG: hypothetical protein [Rhabdoviridae sp.]
MRPKKSHPPSDHELPQPTQPPQATSPAPAGPRLLPSPLPVTRGDWVSDEPGRLTPTKTERLWRPQNPSQVPEREKHLSSLVTSCDIFFVLKKTLTTLQSSPTDQPGPNILDMSERDNQEGKVYKGAGVSGFQRPDLLTTEELSDLKTLDEWTLKAAESFPRGEPIGPEEEIIGAGQASDLLSPTSLGRRSDEALSQLVTDMKLNTAGRKRHRAGDKEKHGGHRKTPRSNPGTPRSLTPEPSTSKAGTQEPPVQEPETPPEAPPSPAPSTSSTASPAKSGSGSNVARFLAKHRQPLSSLIDPSNKKDVVVTVGEGDFDPESDLLWRVKISENKATKTSDFKGIDIHNPLVFPVCNPRSNAKGLDWTLGIIDRVLKICNLEPIQVQYSHSTQTLTLLPRDPEPPPKPATSDASIPVQSPGLAPATEPEPRPGPSSSRDPAPARGGVQGLEPLRELLPKTRVRMQGGRMGVLDLLALHSSVNVLSTLETWDKKWAILAEEDPLRRQVIAHLAMGQVDILLKVDDPCVMEIVGLLAG